MRALWATYTRELRAYFLSPLAYIVLFFFLVVNGAIFVFLILNLIDPRVMVQDPALFYFFRFSWLMLLLLVPVLTMRLISEELRSGSIEILMTAPITESQVVAGKYLAAFTFYASLWLPTLVYGILIARQSEVDWGPVAAGYLGILGIGAFLLAVGTFASATTRSQLVAAMVSVSLVLLLFLLAWFAERVDNEVLKQALSYADLFAHIDEFARGIVDTRRLTYYGTGVLFFLFLATRALEDKKWR